MEETGPENGGLALLEGVKNGTVQGKCPLVPFLRLKKGGVCTKFVGFHECEGCPLVFGHPGTGFIVLLGILWHHLNRIRRVRK